MSTRSRNELVEALRGLKRREEDRSGLLGNSSATILAEAADLLDSLEEREEVEVRYRIAGETIRVELHLSEAQARDLGKCVCGGEESQCYYCLKSLLAVKAQVRAALASTQPEFPQVEGPQQFREFGKRLLGDAAIEAAMSAGYSESDEGEIEINMGDALAAAWNHATGHEDFPLGQPPEEQGETDWQQEITLARYSDLPGEPWLVHPDHPPFAEAIEVRRYCPAPEGEER